TYTTFTGGSGNYHFVTNLPAVPAVGASAPSLGNVYMEFNVTDFGDKSSANMTLVLSHGCPGTTQTAADLTVTKDATPSFTKTYKWTTDKSADPTTVYSAGGGESGKTTYTASATHDSGTEGDWQVSGTIVVHNPNDDDVSGVDVTDAIDNGGDCTVTGGD